LTRLLFARHGNTTRNSAERFWGRTDVELSEEGIKQSEGLRDRLATEKVTAVYCSQLRRARETAEIVAAAHHLPTTVCEELLEIDFGQAEGLTFNEIVQRFPEVMKAWPTRDLNFSYPGGESMGEMNSRVSRFPARLQKHALDDTVLIVAHAGVIRLLLCHLLKLEPFHWRHFRTDLASLSIIDGYPQTVILSLLNDVCHLR
jgi:alpha-ribazole phosphatase